VRHMQHAAVVRVFEFMTCAGRTESGHPTVVSKAGSKLLGWRGKYSGVKCAVLLNTATVGHPHVDHH
jgi:hypothetical protein